MPCEEGFINFKFRHQCSTTLKQCSHEQLFSRHVLADSSTAICRLFHCNLQTLRGPTLALFIQQKTSAASIDTVSWPGVGRKVAQKCARVNIAKFAYVSTYCCYELFHCRALLTRMFSAVYPLIPNRECCAVSDEKRLIFLHSQQRMLCSQWWEEVDFFACPTDV